MVSINAPRIGLPEARAMVRWKRTSWMRYSWGSSSEAYISATSSASSAMCSSVARSAASAATLDSMTMRASNICQGRKPWSAPRTVSELESRAGGPLETKVTFVSSGPPALDSSSLTVLGALHGFLPWQMFEARIVIESNVAALAAERATDEHIAELAEEVAEMYASLDDPQEYLIHDVRFHRTIARAAGNPILGALMETITANLYGYRSKTVQNAQDLKESAEMHREIYRAIRSHNPGQARQTMEQHLKLASKAQAAETDLTAVPHPDEDTPEAIPTSTT